MIKNTLFALSIFAFSPLFAEVTGEELENRFWQAVKDKKWSEVEKLQAPFFQSIEVTGVHDKIQEIQALSGLNVNSFTISDMKVTKEADICVVTYVIELAETIQGERIAVKAYRISVWQNFDGVWQLIAHANLNPAAPM